MWNLIQFLLYDLPYFLYKSADKLKWDMLIAYIVYSLGKISGTRVIKRVLQRHFKWLKEDSEEWKKYVTKQIVELGGEPYIPVREYVGSGKRSKRSDRKNLDTSLTSSLKAINQEGKLMKKKVVIDAGHGGVEHKLFRIKGDPGAISVTGVKEKDINLATALKVRELMSNHPDIEIILTREKDVFIELGERAKIANRLKADIFISIHVNSWQSNSSGTETEYTREDSIPLAKVLQKHMVKAIGFRDRGINKMNLAVTRETTMPAALLEPGFLSNPVEEAILVSPDFITTYAESIARGICEYFAVAYEVIPPLPITPKGTYPVFVVLGENQFNGLIIDNRSYVPAKETFAALNFTDWVFKNKSIWVSGTQLETKILSNTSFIKATDLKAVGLMKNVFLDPDAINTKRVLLIPSEVSTNE